LLAQSTQLTAHDRLPSTDSEGTPVEHLRLLAVKALKQMYRPERGLFAFRIRRNAEGMVLEGVSRRYTAISLIGLAMQKSGVADEVLHGESAQAVCRRLVDDVQDMDNLGDVALTLWAARAQRDERASVALGRLRELRPVEGGSPTVELAWSLAALAVAGSEDSTDEELARHTAQRLVSSFVPDSGMFPHWPAGARRLSLRSHVTCFADLVYPVQALAHYHGRTGDQQALATARRCAERICALQGAAGQWWWHYDVRTGRVVEPYPVYAVHQDAMGPMALLDLQDVCDAEFREAIDRGVQWLMDPPETGRPLIDKDHGVIWRKVARREPGKLSRRLQAITSRIHRDLRLPGLDSVLRPGCVDYECRPYHLGWLLYAWADGRCGA
jgi:hypothetical protein